MFNMSYETCKKSNSNVGSVNHHLMPMTFNECMSVLASHIKRGYTIKHLTIWRA